MMIPTIGDKFMQEERILVIGACGQLGRELTQALKEKYGKKNVVASDIKELSKSGYKELKYIRLDVTNKAHVLSIITDEKITQVYHLAAMLSATGEKDPHLAWQVNMDGLLNVLDVCVKRNVSKVFWPSSIAVFGPDSPKASCSQNSYAVPTTVYGISKRSGEYWCKYYFDRYGLDVRSLRFPGLISYKVLPGGGTTDYAVDIFYKAKSGEKFTCFLDAETVLPMMFMNDAVRATLELMAAEKEKINIRTSYNLSAVSFSPSDLSTEIRKFEPGFEIEYAPDFRQAIADSWPAMINDNVARHDWGWRHDFGLREIVGEMMEHIIVEEKENVLLDK